MGYGIVSYGAYLPRFRLPAREITRAWGRCAAGIKEKTVMDFDEDVLTMGVAAAEEALSGTFGPGSSGLSAEDIAVLTIASTNLPYTEKVSGGTLACMLGLRNELITTEHTTSTRSGTEGLLALASVLKAGGLPAGLLISADAPRARASDPLDHGLGAGAAAFLLGERGVLAEIEDNYSCVDEYLGERFRPAGETNLRDIGVPGYTAEAFNRVVSRSVKGLLGQLGRRPGDYHHLVIQQPEGKLPKAVAAKLGFNEAQLTAGWLYPNTGDTGAASSLLGLAAALDSAAPGQRILLVSYGSGSGSDAVSLVVSDDRGRRAEVRPWRDRRVELDYMRYLKLRKQIS